MLSPPACQAQRITTAQTPEPCAAGTAVNPAGLRVPGAVAGQIYEPGEAAGEPGHLSPVLISQTSPNSSPCWVQDRSAPGDELPGFRAVPGVVAQASSGALERSHQAHGALPKAGKGDNSLASGNDSDYLQCARGRSMALLLSAVSERWHGS